MRFAAALLLALLLPFGAAAQDFSGLARIDPAQSSIRDGRGGLIITLNLSQPIPYRVFTLTDPGRLVLDFREVDWRGANQLTLLQTERAVAVRYGVLRPGWSRMVVDLGEPLVVTQAGMDTGKAEGRAVLTVRLAPASAEDFAAASGVPPDPGWDMLATADPVRAPTPAADDGILVVAVDPGHGGIDPGADREGLREAEVMLQLGLELAEAIDRTGGMHAVLTRRADVFVPLEERMTIARAAGADVLISLHADALEEGGAQGASVYTLSREAQDRASERMAERHDRGDLLAGLDLSGHDDQVATALMDLARLETAPRSLSLAAALVAGLERAGARMNSKPRREAMLAVLNAADFPSVLLETGFLSNGADRETLTTQAGRSQIVAGIVRGLQAWALDEAAKAPLLRQ